MKFSLPIKIGNLKAEGPEGGTGFLGFRRGWIDLASKVLLAGVAFSLLVFLLQVMSGPLTFSQADSNCSLTATSDGGPDGRGTVAFMGTATVKNNCKTPFTGTLFAGKAWCSGVAPDGHCGANLSWSALISGTLGAGATIKIPVNISQEIGNNGQCGSAQVDISVDKKTALSGHWAFAEPCKPPPPPQRHKDCRNNACKMVSGPGADKCTTDNDCKPQMHLACQGEACVSVAGPGQNQCSADADCKAVTHKACQEQACVVVSGPGQNQCNTNADCVPVAHMACQDQACVSVSGPGQNQCSADADCKTPTHLACQNEACVSVSGPGQNQCNVDNDCKTVTHLACQDQACKAVTGPGQNQCSTDSDCVTTTHMTCQNEACVSVSGAGQNQCSSEADCKAVTHKACQNNACISFSGPGSNQCSSDSDCVSAAQSVFCDSLTVSPQSGNSPLSVTASLSGHTVNGGSVAGYKFDFGDGSGESGQQSSNSMSHTYTVNTSSSFTVNGFVVDNLGNTAGGSGGCQKTVAVAPAGAAPPPPPPGQVLGAIPKTGAETEVLVGLLGSGTVGLIIKKYFLKRFIG